MIAAFGSGLLMTLSGSKRSGRFAHRDIIGTGSFIIANWRHGGFLIRKHELELSSRETVLSAYRLRAISKPRDGEYLLDARGEGGSTTTARRNLAHGEPRTAPAA
jgi:hypothetical protein